MLGRDPGEILTRNERIDAVTPQMLQDAFKQVLPDGSLHGRDAGAGAEPAALRAGIRDSGFGIQSETLFVATAHRIVSYRTKRRNPYKPGGSYSAIAAC